MRKKPSTRIEKSVLETLRGKSPHERFLHRLHSVIFVLNGYSVSEIGRIYDDSPRAVAYWLKRFEKDGLQGLHEEARTGRPTKISPSQFIRLQKVLALNAKKTKKVKAEILAQYILTEFGIALTVRQCWRIMNRLTT